MAVVMLIITLMTYLFVVPLVNTAASYFAYLIEAPSGGWTAYTEIANSTVWGVLASHLGLITVIFIVWGYLRFVQQRRMVWLWSVSPGVRWRFGVICLFVCVIVVGAVSTYRWFTATGWNPEPKWIWFLVVVVLTTPFQALAEEVLFRGYLMQLCGSILRNDWFAIIATALIFALFHGSQDPWLFGSRFTFGLLAGFLVLKTGGLEAAVAIHILNNLCAYGLAILTGTVADIRSATSVSWTQAVTEASMYAVCAAICWGIAVKLRVPTKVRSTPTKVSK